MGGDSDHYCHKTQLQSYEEANSRYLMKNLALRHFSGYQWILLLKKKNQLFKRTKNRQHEPTNHLLESQIVTKKTIACEVRQELLQVRVTQDQNTWAKENKLMYIDIPEETQTELYFEKFSYWM